MSRGVVGSAVLICALVAFSIPVCLHAKGMYVRDWIVITLRSAPNETSLAMGTASTNEQVEVLEEGKGWMRIQTKDGKEGWVAGRFLSAQPPKTLYVKQLEDKFLDCVSFSAKKIPKANVERSIELIRRLEEVQDATEVIRLLA